MERIKSGRGVPCKEMHPREFRAFAAEIGERIGERMEAKCIFAPPRTSEDCF
nr:hypothetical protein [Candidatus Freyrarchaeum guaymaensis]